MQVLRYAFLILPFLALNSRALANPSVEQSGFLPKSSMTCRDPRTGHDVSLTVHTEIARAGGHVYNDQVLKMHGASYRSYFTTIPSQNDVIPGCEESPENTICFKYIPAIDWRKAGYDYDTGEFSAKIDIGLSTEFYQPLVTLDHCR